MSLETQIGSLVSAANNLTGEVAGKMSEIDSKVDEATSSVANTIGSLMHQNFFVDAVSGNDSNKGESFSDAKKTIANAIDTAPPKSNVVVYLKNEGVHHFDRRIKLEGKVVTIVTHSGNYQDPSSLADVVQDWWVRNDLYEAAGIQPGMNGFLKLDKIKLSTAVLPVSEASNNREILGYKSSFVSGQSGYGGVIIKDAIVNIGNFAFMHQHQSGDIGFLDLTLVNSDVMKSDIPQELSEGKINQSLIAGYYGGTGDSVPFSFTVAKNVSTNAASWFDLITANTDLMTTNAT